MRNFILFISKYHIFFFFLGLQIGCFVLISRNNSFHHSGIVNSSNVVVGKLFEWRSGFTEYINLKRVNAELAEENEQLRNQLKGNYVNVNEHFVMINDTLRERKYQYKTAEVINKSINKQRNFLTINKGSNEGITPEMGVINAHGLVGIVKDVSEHFSTVIPIINISYTASVEIKRTGNFGLLNWRGEDYRYAYIEDIAKHVAVELGDTIVTRSASAIYPKGIFVGTVSRIVDEPGSNYFDIQIKLGNDFSSIHYVSVLENLLKEEQLELENKSEGDAD